LASNAREIQKSASGLPKDAEQFQKLASAVLPSLAVALKSTTTTDQSSQDFCAYIKSLQVGITDFLAELDAIKSRNTKRCERYKTALKIWHKREQFQKSLEMIEQASSQIPMRLVTVYLPKVDSKLDDIGIQLSTNLQDLMTAIQQTQASKNNDAVLKIVEKWFQDRNNLKAQRKCLQALYFPKLDSRETEVRDAHSKTFGWILENGSSSDDINDTGLNVVSQESAVHQKSIKFQHWLQSEDSALSNVFWITGKPGSGKSTMMKFLAYHPALRILLGAWQEDKTLILIHHYFWKEGSPLQRSLMGLLRSILYQALEQCPALIDVAFNNDRWLNGGEDFQFSSEALHGALKNVLASGPGLGLKFFLLIDGLDEFDDQDAYQSDVSNERDLIDFLRIFYHKPSVKLCVASRPLNIFRYEFGEEKDLHLYLHDLTRKYIRVYVQETLEKERIFQKLIQRDEGYQELIHEIIDAADGVFLWVHIVTRRLLDGMTNADRFSDLQRKLRELPRELEHLSEHILKSLDAEKKRRAARILLALATVSASYITPLIAAFIYLDPSEHLGIIKREDWTVENLRRLQKELRAPIYACCRGLVDIEVSSTGINVPWETLGFAHRTFGDFLRHPRIKSSLIEAGDIDEVIICYYGCKGILAVFQAMAFACPSPDRELLMLKSFSRWTRHLEGSGHDDLAYELRLDLEHLCNADLSDTGYDIINEQLGFRRLLPEPYREKQGNIITLAVTVRWGLRYLERRLSEDAGRLKPQGCTLALVIHLKQVKNEKEYVDLSNIMDIPRVLLKYGADLNHPVGDTVYWDLFIDSVWRLWRDLFVRVLSFVEMLEACLQHGPYLDVQYKMSINITPGEHWILSERDELYGRVLVIPGPRTRGVFYLSSKSIVQTILRYFPLQESGTDESLLSSIGGLPEAGLIEARAIEEMYDLAEAEGWGGSEDESDGSEAARDRGVTNALKLNSQDLAAYRQWKANRRGKVIQEHWKVNQRRTSPVVFAPS
jgi:hypothetical protein